MSAIELEPKDRAMLAVMKRQQLEIRFLQGAITMLVGLLAAIVFFAGTVLFSNVPNPIVNEALGNASEANVALGLFASNVALYASVIAVVLILLINLPTMIRFSRKDAEYEKAKGLLGL